MMIGYDVYDRFTMEHFSLRPKFKARDCKVVCEKKTGKENFPNVNLVLSIC
jgi:hypothetical protein